MVVREGVQRGTDRLTVLVIKDIVFRGWIELTREYGLAVFLKIQCDSRMRYSEFSDRAL